MSPPPAAPAASSAPPAPSGRPPGAPGSWDRRFDYLLTIVFLIFAVYSGYHHEFWRDEMQAWLIGRDLPTPLAVIHHARYEGSPPLWNLALWALAQATSDPRAMQVLTCLLATATFFVLCRHAPLDRLQKILLLGNYYVLYQYGTVCRNYLPGILALCLACALILAPRPRPWCAAMCLVASAFASVHSLILSVALAAAFWGAPLLARLLPARIRATLGPIPGQDESPRKTIALLACTGAGLALAVYSVLPAADTFYGPAHDWRFQWSPVYFAKVCWAFVTSGFTWPRPPGFFWIPPWDTPFPSYDDRVAMMAAAALWLVGIVLFLRSPRALVAYLAGTVGIALFLYVKYVGFSRHTGFLFFAFLFAWWIFAASPPTLADRFTRWRRLAPGLLLTAMLATQALTGFWAVREDRQSPFSGGRKAAQFIRDIRRDTGFIAVGPDWAGSPISGYLERPVFLPHAKRHGSFTRWNHDREDNLTDEEFFARASAEAAGRRMVLLLDHPFEEEFCKRHRIRFLYHAGGSLTPFEDYFIFEVAGTP